MSRHDQMCVWKDGDVFWCTAHFEIPSEEKLVFLSMHRDHCNALRSENVKYCVFEEADCIHDCDMFCDGVYKSACRCNDKNDMWLAIKIVFPTECMTTADGLKFVYRYLRQLPEMVFYLLFGVSKETNDESDMWPMMEEIAFMHNKTFVPGFDILIVVPQSHILYNLPNGVFVQSRVEREGMKLAFSGGSIDFKQFLDLHPSEIDTHFERPPFTHYPMNVECSHKVSLTWMVSSPWLHEASLPLVHYNNKRSLYVVTNHEIQMVHKYENGHTLISHEKPGHIGFQPMEDVSDLCEYEYSWYMKAVACAARIRCEVERAMDIVDLGDTLFFYNLLPMPMPCCNSLTMKKMLV